MFKRSLCDISQWNPLTESFSAYLHVCLSLFSILCSHHPFCICSLSPFLYLWSQLFMLWSYTLCICLVTDSLCSSDCPLVDPLCLLPFLENRLIVLHSLPPQPISYLSLFFYVCLSPLQVADSLFQLTLLHTCRGEHFPLPDLWLPKRLEINTLVDNRSYLFKSLIHFYQTSMFYVSRAESVILMQICLGPYMDTNTHTWLTHKHIHT